MAQAAELATQNQKNCHTRLKDLEEYFLKKLTSNFPDAKRNGNPDNGLPGLISISFPGHRSDIIMVKLDRKNIAVSNGAACNTGNIKLSTVLKEMGIKDDLNLSTVRISFGHNNNKKEIDLLISALKEII